MREHLVRERYTCWRGGVRLLLAVGAALSLAVAPVSCIAQEAGKSLTLDEAIKIALANNKSVAVARARLGKAEAQLRQARAGDNPRLGVDGNYTRMGPPVEVTFSGEGGGPPTTINVSPGEQMQTRASLSKVLDVFGQIRLGADIADYQRAIQELDLERTIQQLTLDVKQAYYDVLRAQARRKVVEQAVQASEEHLRIAEVQFRAGVAPKFDVTRAEVDVANNRQDFVAASNGVKLTQSALNNTLGVDVSSPTEVENAGIGATAGAKESDIPRNTKEAYKSRPEVLQAEIGAKLSNRAVELNKRGLWPVLTSSATYNWNGKATAFSSKWSWTAGLGFSIPIWDGGITKAKVDEAKSDLDAAKAQLEQLKLAVALDVRSSILSLIESADRISTAGENVRQAEEALRLAQVRYQSGISTAVEVTDAEVALTQARTNEVNANYDYLVALARLERAVGAEPELGGASGQAIGS